MIMTRTDLTPGPTPLRGGGAHHSDIRIALPSKGRMQPPTLEFLSHCGFDVKQSVTRSYVGTIS